MLAALIFAPTAFAATPAVAPVIRVGEPTPLVSASDTAVGAPSILWSIPKYTLTPGERETVAACLVLESASQGEFGMRGVMAVIRNRARGLPELFAPTVLRPKQFSAFNKLTSGRETLAHLVARARRDRMWPTALAVVDDALTDAWHDPTGGATHFTLSGERNRWTRSLATTVTIGAHSFYR
jgi:spore germination cell wall hydrolase CwlJ-like protein